MLFIIIFLIVLIVAGLLGYAMWRFDEKRNPEPAKFTHNITIEVIWTIIPVLILLVIIVPSFKLMYYMDRAVDPDMTLVVNGYQWYWGYEYPDQEVEEFLANMVADEDLEPWQPRLLTTDNVVVVPVDTTVQVLVTAKDVIHSWAMPAFGLKKDAVPGRFNETWFHVTEEGTYYGQCSEICGINHAFMPIEVKAVSQEKFDQWVELAKEDIEAATTFIRTEQRMTLAHK